MYTTGIIHTSRSFHIYTDTGDNLQCTIIHGASPCLNLPLLTLLCSPLPPFYLLGTLLAVTGSVHLGPRLLVNWPALSHPSSQPLPSPNFPEPLVAQRLTKTNSGPVRRLLSGTLKKSGLLTSGTCHCRVWLTTERACCILNHCANNPPLFTVYNI